MLRTLPALLILLLAPGLALAAPSEITDVTVFTDRAEVTRTLTIDLPRGASSVEFAGLPAQLISNSLRVQGSSPRAPVTLGALTHETRISRDLTSEREQALTNALEGLEHKMRLLNAERGGVNVRQEFAQSLGREAALRSDEAIAELRLDPQEWVAAGQALQAEVSAMMAARAELDLRQQALQRDIDKARQELAQLRTGQRRSVTVTVPVEADGPTPLTLRLSYQVPGASWRPLYDARLSTHDGALELTRYGEVAQRTGEDWDGVALTLSTAQPQRGAALPSLSPLWVDMHQGAGAGFDADKATYGDGMASTALQAMPEPQEEAALQRWKDMQAEHRTATVQSGEFAAARYTIPGPARVASGAQAVKVMIGEVGMKTALEVHVRPQLSVDAFLAARTTLDGDAPLLPGAVKLFRDGAYVGESRFALLRPGDEDLLFFGVDDKVSVERETLKDTRRDAGIVMRDNTLERRFVTTVKNLHAGPVTVVVREATPAPRNKRLSAEILSSATTPGYTADADDVKGLAEWRLALPGGAEERVELGWRLTWPKDHAVSVL